MPTCAKEECSRRLLEECRPGVGGGIWNGKDYHTAGHLVFACTTRTSDEKRYETNTLDDESSSHQHPTLPRPQGSRGSSPVYPPTKVIMALDPRSEHVSSSIFCPQAGYLQQISNLCLTRGRGRGEGCFRCLLGARDFPASCSGNRRKKRVEPYASQTKPVSIEAFVFD